MSLSSQTCGRNKRTSRVWLISRHSGTVAGIRFYDRSLLPRMSRRPKKLGNGQGRKAWLASVASDSRKKGTKKLSSPSFSHVPHPPYDPLGLGQVSVFFRACPCFYFLPLHGGAEAGCAGRKLCFPKGPKGCDDRPRGQCLWRSKACVPLSRLRSGGDFRALVNTTYSGVPQVLPSRSRRLAVMKERHGDFFFSASMETIC